MSSELAVANGHSQQMDHVGVGGMFVASPRDVVKVGIEVATEVAKLIRERKLSKNIQGREYVMVEGWSTAAAMLGLTAREVDVTENAEGDYIAVVELVRVTDGTVIGRASALCGADEPTWANRPRYARRSMAVTRAAGKACRLSLSWIIKLAGFEPTPAEEMPDEPAQTSPAPRLRVVNEAVPEPPPTHSGPPAPVPPAQANDLDATALIILARFQNKDRKWNTRGVEEVHNAMRKVATQRKRKADVEFYREYLAEIDNKATNGDAK